MNHDNPDDNPDDESDGTEGTEDTGGSRFAWVSTVLPAVMLLVGVLIGVLVAGVGGGAGDGDEPAAGPSAGVTSTGPATAVVVPDSCLESAQTVREATDAIRGGVEAVRNFEPDKILALLDRLEDLDKQARAQAETCTGTEITDAGTPTPTDAATPTAAPPTEGQDSEAPTASPTP